MKKTLLALAALASASMANAATVYDKDGTQLAIGGRIQAVVYNGNYKKAHNDSTLVNSSRLNVYGSSKVNDVFSVFAFTEWNMADGNKAANGESINTRDQYIGADFNRYGKLVAGKTYDAIYAVQAVTDIFEDVAVTAQGETCADRRTGTIKYTYDNYGFFAQVAGLTAGDSVLIMGSNSFTGLSGNDAANDVKGGYSAALGYTFDDVVFGPLSLKASYSYIKGTDEASSPLSAKSFDTFKNTAASVSWGDDSNGLYLAALYTQTVTEYEELGFGNEERKMKGAEIIGGYSFDNGFSLLTGYEIGDETFKNQKKKFITRRIPVYLNYKLNSNFNVWAEAEFDANSSDEAKKAKRTNTDTLLSVGARYTF